MGAKNAGGRDDRSDPEIERLIDEGLERYGRGDLKGALQAWENALWLSPGEARATGYVDYLRSNYQLLTSGTASAAELAVPFGLTTLDDEAAYEVEIVSGRAGTGGNMAEPGAWTPDQEFDRHQTVDDGWFLDEDTGITSVGRPLPLPPSRLGRSSDATGDLDYSDATGEQTAEIRDRALGFVRPVADGRPPESTAAGNTLAHLGPGLPGVAWASADANTTEMRLRIRDRESPGNGALDFGGELDLGDGAGSEPEASGAPPGDDELTLERGDWSSSPSQPEGTTMAPLNGDDDAGTEPPLVIVEDPVLADSNGSGTVPLQAGNDDDSDEFEADQATAERSGLVGSADLTPIGGSDAVSMDVVAREMLSQLDRAAPAGEASDERIRRRIGSLLERASHSSGTGHHPIAVTAIDLALSEDPDSAVAQKLIHSSREAILGIYQRFIGDLAARPVLAVPMHELGSEDLDSRAAFLLSRVDGVLSFEEILDIAGMSRLEAFRYLSRMLLRGILEVR